MKAFIAMVGWTGGNRPAKYQDFDVEAEADAHVAVFGGFSSPNPGGGDPRYWIVDAVAKTLTYDSAQEAADIAAAPNNRKTRLIESFFADPLNVALWTAVNNGNFVPGSFYTLPQIKQILRDEM